MRRDEKGMGRRKRGLPGRPGELRYSCSPCLLASLLACLPPRISPRFGVHFRRLTKQAPNTMQWDLPYIQKPLLKLAALRPYVLPCIAVGASSSRASLSMYGPFPFHFSGLFIHFSHAFPSLGIDRIYFICCGYYSIFFFSRSTLLLFVPPTAPTRSPSAVGVAWQRRGGDIEETGAVPSSSPPLV